MVIGGEGDLARHWRWLVYNGRLGKLLRENAVDDVQLWAVMTTVETRDQAEHLARTLVEGRLAACVSIGAPVTSVYPWQHKIETAEEIPLLIKTSPKRLEALKSSLKERHPYDVPELLAMPVVDGLPAYFAWAQDWTDND